MPIECKFHLIVELAKKIVRRRSGMNFLDLIMGVPKLEEDGHEGFFGHIDAVELKLNALEGIEKIIRQGDTVVLVDASGKRYVARPEPNEKFDLEKGLMCVLLKYFGVSTTMVQELLAKVNVKEGTNKKCDKKKAENVCKKQVVSKK